MNIYATTNPLYSPETAHSMQYEWHYADMFRDNKEEREVRLDEEPYRIARANDLALVASLIIAACDSLRFSVQANKFRRGGEVHSLYRPQRHGLRRLQRYAHNAIRA